MPDLVVLDIGTATPVPPTDTCDTTLATVINRTRRELLTGRREELNKLDGAIDDNDESVTTRFAAGGIGPQTRLAIDLEHLHVWSIDGTTASVERGMDGSTPAAHDDDAIIRVNPRYSDFEILNAVNDVLRDLSSPSCGLFAVYALDLDYDPDVVAYDLTGVENLEGLLEVHYRTPSDEKDWVRIPQRGWRIQRSADTTDFASGLALTIFGRVGANAGDTIRVAYKSRYQPLTAYDDNVELTTGLHCDAHDLLWIGAALRLTEGQEIDRNQTRGQGDPRRAQEVPSGAKNAAPGGLSKRWKDRLSAEAGRLARRYPTRLAYG